VSRTARLPRRVLVPVVAVIAAALTLSGCAAGQISQTADQVAAIDGANGSTGYIGVRNALLAMPDSTTGYAKGADAPLQLWVSNSGVNPYTLSGVTSSAATSVQITGTATVPGQSLTDFTGSSVKLTMKSLTSAITYGESVPVTFNFTTAAGASSAVTVNVPVAIPAERTGGRPTIVIQPTEGGNVWDSEAPQSSSGG
jgi:hypothetical protein